ncbi:MAG TPA: MFS transporter [Clostridiaceae bacterium]|nr:MFS transporter [Clostridiaceae bacterium]
MPKRATENRCADSHDRTQDLHSKELLAPFYFLLLGDLVAVVGHGISSFVPGILIFQATGQVIYLSPTILAGFLLAIILAPRAGVLADRYDRRLLLIIGDGLRSLAIWGMVVVQFVPYLRLWQIILSLVIASIISYLVQPATRTTITDLVAPDIYQGGRSISTFSGG